MGPGCPGPETAGAVAKSINKELAKSANQLYEDVKKEGEDWKTSAEAAVESDPVKAYDLYTDVATAFAGDELGKSVAAPLKKLAKDKAVVAELAARKAFAQYLTAAGKLPPQQKGDGRQVAPGHRQETRRHADGRQGDRADQGARVSAHRKGSGTVLDPPDLTNELPSFRVSTIRGILPRSHAQGEAMAPPRLAAAS